jgi:hypothetical protein
MAHTPGRDSTQAKASCAALKCSGAAMAASASERASVPWSTGL